MSTPTGEQTHHHTLAIEASLTGDTAPSPRRASDEKRTTFTYTRREGLPFCCALLGAFIDLGVSPRVVSAMPRVLEGYMHAAWDDARFHERMNFFYQMEGSTFWEYEDGRRIMELITCGADLDAESKNLIAQARAILAGSHLGETTVSRWETSRIMRCLVGPRSLQCTSERGELYSHGLHERVWQHTFGEDRARWLPMLAPAAFTLPTSREDLFNLAWTLIQLLQHERVLDTTPRHTNSFIIDRARIIRVLLSIVPGEGDIADGLSVRLDDLVEAGILGGWRACPRQEGALEAGTHIEIIWTDIQRERLTGHVPPSAHFMERSKRGEA